MKPEAWEIEIWLDIDGYCGYYQISSFGRVKRLTSKNCTKDRFLKFNFVRGGYCSIKLCIQAVKKPQMVHVLVAKAFIDNPNNYPIVCHDDDNPQNNYYKNLWWGTQKQNIIDCHKKGRAINNLPKGMIGNKNPNYGKHKTDEVRIKLSLSAQKITDELLFAAMEEYRKGGITMRVIHSKYGISPTTLCTMLNGKNNRAKLKQLH